MSLKDTKPTNETTRTVQKIIFFNNSKYSVPNSKTGHRIIDKQIISKRYVEHLKLDQRRQNSSRPDAKKSGKPTASLEDEDQTNIHTDCPMQQKT